jgi:hypothetical protein
LALPSWSFLLGFDVHGDLLRAALLVRLHALRRRAFTAHARLLREVGPNLAADACSMAVLLPCRRDAAGRTDGLGGWTKRHWEQAREHFAVVA